MSKFIRCSRRASLWRVPALASLISVASLTALVGPMANAASIVSDFSNTSNPNGVWSYYYGTSPTTQTAYTASQGYSVCPNTGLPCWYNGGGVPDALTIQQNSTGSTSTYLTIVVPNGTISLDPEEYAVAVVFTAPVANTYNIAGNFLGIDVDQNSHPVQILDNGAVIYSNTISAYGQDDSFNLSEHLTAGETISFYVGTGSSGCTYCFLSTGLDGTVTASAAPEPSSLALLALPLMGFAVVPPLLRRKAQKAESSVSQRRSSQ